MGELIFSFAYGGALITMGFVTRFFLNKMEAERKAALAERTPKKVVAK